LQGRKTPVRRWNPKQNIRIFSTLFILTGILFVSGCTLHEVNPTPATPVEVPAQFVQAGEEDPTKDPWWTAFNDPTLNNLIHQTLHGNRSLHAGWARLKQMDAIGRQAQSGLFPSIEGEVGYNGNRTNMKFGSFSNSAHQDRYSLSLSAGYEVDLWNRVASGISAAETELRASREDLEAQAMTLAAQTAEIWFNIRATRAQIDGIKNQRKLADKHLEALRFRFSQGFGAIIEIFQQEERIASIETQEGPLKAQVQTLLHQLAVLQGSHPRANLAETDARALPTLPPLPPLGVPSNLLKNRPDIKAAQLAIVAADHRLAVAIADQFPSLRLGGSLGFTSIDSLSTFLEDWVYSVLASLSGSVWDGGRKSAEVERNKAVVEERIHLYGQTILNAMREVEDAIVLETKQVEYIEALETQLRLARKTEAELTTRFLSGVGEFLPVLASRERIAQMEISLLLAKRQQLSYRVQLCRALGGNWTDGLNPPSVADSSVETPKESSPDAQEIEKEVEEP